MTEIISLCIEGGSAIGMLGLFVILSRRIDSHQVRLDVIDERHRLLIERLATK